MQDDVEAVGDVPGCSFCICGSTWPSADVDDEKAVMKRRCLLSRCCLVYTQSMQKQGSERTVKACTLPKNDVFCEISPRWWGAVLVL